MKNEVLQSYLLYLVPAFAIPAVIHVMDANVSVLNLVKTGLLYPMLLLALKGLTTFFPEENLRKRSIGRMAEYALLQGMVFATVLLLFTGFTQPEMQLNLLFVGRQFGIMVLAISIPNFLIARSNRKKLSSS